MYACLAVTCHLHFWQNDRDFLRATVVTRGWNGYRNKSQHRKSTLEKKILPPFQQGFEPRPFNHESGALTTELFPPPTALHNDCFLYSAAILRSPADSLCSRVILHEWIAFYSAVLFFVLNIHRSGVLTALAWLEPHETVAVSGAFCVHHTIMHRVTSCKATCVGCMRV